MENLGTVYAMGADMYDHPQAYAFGKNSYPTASWFAKLAERHLHLYKQDMDARSLLEDCPRGWLI